MQLNLLVDVSMIKPQSLQTYNEFASPTEDIQDVVSKKKQTAKPLPSPEKIEKEFKSIGIQTESTAKVYIVMFLN
jgi:3-mercaptopyruvate sulfurtransferase SseA